MKNILTILFVILSSTFANAQSVSISPPALPLTATNGGTGLAGSLTGARKANGTGVDTQAACSDISNGGTFCSAAAASKVDQQTGTSAVVATTPSQQQQHPSAAKAVVFGNGGTTPTVAIGYNVASVSRASIGLYNITMTVPFSSALYAVLCTAQNASTNVSTSTYATIVSASVFSVNHNENATAADPANYTCVAYGTQ